MKKATICTIISIVCVFGIISIHSCNSSSFNPYGKYHGSNGTYGGTLVINEDGNWKVTWEDEGGQQTVSGKYHYGDKKLFGQGTVYIPGIGYQDSGYTEYGEFVGNDIRSGGWIFKKVPEKKVSEQWKQYIQETENGNIEQTEIQYKHVGKNDVKYLHVFNQNKYGAHVRIVITKSKNKVTGLEFLLDSDGILWDISGNKCGEIKFSNNYVRVSGIKGVSGKYVKGDYTYETGPIIGE